MTSSVRERSYTNKKEALVLKRQPRASLANFLSQYLTFQSVLAFLDVDPKKYTEQGTLLSAQFSSWKRVPKSSSSPGTETGPRFWLSSSKVQAHAIRGPKLAIMPFLLEQKPHLLTQLVVVFKSKQNLAQLCSAASCRCSFKTSYTNKKEALVLKRQPRASLANFLRSVLAFLDVDPKKYTEQGTLLSAQFSSWKRVPKSSSSPGTETGPRFWLSSSKVQAHAIRGPKLELRLGSHFWGPIMPFLLEQKPHLLTQLVVVFKSKQNLAQLCSAASCRCSFKT